MEAYQLIPGIVIFVLAYALGLQLSKPRWLGRPIILDESFLMSQTHLLSGSTTFGYVGKMETLKGERFYLLRPVKDKRIYLYTIPKDIRVLDEDRVRNGDVIVIKIHSRMTLSFIRQGGIETSKSLFGDY
ncbi:hypothetical protein D4R49_00645 [bacterium]|nr:MAG: hypothetical protein D4R49_00645 [bacterium]